MTIWFIRFLHINAKIIPKPHLPRYNPLMPHIIEPPVPASHRFVTRDGHVNVERQGLEGRRPARDWYHRLLTLTWAQTILFITCIYLLLNSLFAMLYLLDPNDVSNLHNNNFADAFFFSVQTLSTVGYGWMVPKTFYANCVVTVECLTGMASIGLITGLLFSRFSRPTARVMFSHFAVISAYEGLPTFIFRAANKRGNQLLQAEIRVTLARNETTLEGEPLRRFYDLKLVRERTSFFSLTWMVRHQIDVDSPLYASTPESLELSETEIIVLLSGIDDVFRQTVHGRFAYNHEEIKCGYRFVDMFSRDGQNRPIINYANFNEILPTAHHVHGIDDPA